MNRENEIRSIKEEQRRLADRLEALEKEDVNPRPKAGEVWKSWSGGKILALENYKLNRGCAFWLNGNHKDSMDKNVTLSESQGDTRLGTFDEVYIEREKVKEVIDRALRATDDEGDTLRSVLFGATGCEKVITILNELL